MPTATHSIDGLPFLCLKGDVQERQEQVEAFARGGVPGHGFRRLGSRGEPFELLSIVDAPSLEQAKVGYEAYLMKTAANPVVLIKDGLNWGTYVVMHVSLAPQGIKAIANMAGGINPPSMALLTCKWVLLG